MSLTNFKQIFCYKVTFNKILEKNLDHLLDFFRNMIARIDYHHI